MIPVVHQTGVVGHEQLAAVRHILAHAARGLLGQDGQARQHDGLVLIPRTADRHHVGGQAIVRQRAEPVQRLGPVAHLLRGGGGVLGGPLGLVVEDDGDLGLDQLGVQQALVSKLVEVGTQLAHIAEDLGVGARVGHHGGMPLLGAGLGLTPLEVADGVGAHGQMGQGVAHQLAGLEPVVGRAPVDGGRGMFHEEPRVLAGDAVGEAGRVGHLVEVGLAGREVMVVGHEVHVMTPLVVVEDGAARGDHEVGGLRLGGDLEQGVALGLVEVQQRVGAEALPIKQLARVHEVAVADESRRDDLGEIVHALRPEGGAPGVVDSVDGAVLLLAPLLEGALGVFGIVEVVVAAVLVAHMPRDHIGVVLVVLGHLAAQVERVVKEDRAGGAPVLAGTGLADVAAVVDPEDLRVGLGHPHRRGCGAGGEIDGDAGLAELVDDAVEPIEVVHAFFGLKLGPGEDGYGDEVDAGLLHEGYIFVPHFLRPLVGVVIAAVPDAGLVARKWLRPLERSMFHDDSVPLLHCIDSVHVREWIFSCHTDTRDDAGRGVAVRSATVAGKRIPAPAPSPDR